MPKKEIITSQELPSGAAPLSQAARFGDLVFVQGCTGRHPTSGTVGIPQLTVLRGMDGKLTGGQVSVNGVTGDAEQSSSRRL